MKLNIIFAAILLILVFNPNIIAGGTIDGTNNGGGGTSGNNCHGDFVSSEFNQK